MAAEGLRSDDSAQHFVFDNSSEVSPSSGSCCHNLRNFVRPILRSAHGALASLWYRPHNIRSSQKSSRWISTETLHQTHHSLTIHNLTHLLSFFSLPFVPPSFTSGHRKDSSGSLQGSLDFISMLGVWEPVIGYGLGFLLLLLLTFLSCQL